jgi:Ni/Fe-hydrogenase 1 B-type cytochrome subunit
MEVKQIESSIVTKKTIVVGSKKYSSSIRLWHWLNAVIITGSLLTVLINSTVLKPWTNAALIAEKLKEKGIKISADEAKPVAFALADQVWAIHTYLGYALAALFLFRIGLEYFELADKKLIGKIKTARKSYLLIKQTRIASRNEILVKTSYALFYVLIMVMIVTGLSLAFEDDVAALKSMHFIRDIHGFTMYLILGFIFIHIAGVYLGERKQHKGIISHMVNGGEAEN